ncbi:MAG: hypothetical protein QNJ31_02930 [Candidatus Caenarcaniphilales bacterium]|nr:hypothetical protein [Candidatus Caenarcaniphilales bacterium]
MNKVFSVAYGAKQIIKNCHIPHLVLANKRLVQAPLNQAFIEARQQIDYTKPPEEMLENRFQVLESFLNTLAIKFSIPEEQRTGFINQTIELMRNLVKEESLNGIVNLSHQAEEGALGFNSGNLLTEGLEPLEAFLKQIGQINKPEAIQSIQNFFAELLERVNIDGLTINGQDLIPFLLGADGVTSETIEATSSPKEFSRSHGLSTEAQRVIPQLPTTVEDVLLPEEKNISIREFKEFLKKKFSSNDIFYYIIINFEDTTYINRWIEVFDKTHSLYKWLSSNESKPLNKTSTINPLIDEIQLEVEELNKWPAKSIEKSIKKEGKILKKNVIEPDYLNYLINQEIVQPISTILQTIRTEIWSPEKEFELVLSTFLERHSSNLEQLSTLETQLKDFVKNNGPKEFIDESTRKEDYRLAYEQSHKIVAAIDSLLNLQKRKLELREIEFTREKIIEKLIDNNADRRYNSKISYVNNYLVISGYRGESPIEIWINDMVKWIKENSRINLDYYFKDAPNNYQDRRIYLEELLNKLEKEYKGIPIQVKETAQFCQQQLNFIEGVGISTGNVHIENTDITAMNESLASRINQVGRNIQDFIEENNLNQ